MILPKPKLQLSIRLSVYYDYELGLKCNTLFKMKLDVLW